MNCNEARRWLDAHLDGELDLARDTEVAAHIAGCTDCTERARGRAAWNATVTQKLPRFTPPPHLATRIRAELRAAGSGAAANASAERAGEGSAKEAGAGSREGAGGWTIFARRAFGFQWWGGMLAAATCALVIGFALGQRHDGTRGMGGDGLLASHTNALTSGHLIDVVSSDRHTVKPWLAEHVDFSPPVRDFVAEGFSLDGARVERIDGRTVAALVYHRAKHIVTVYVWPKEDAGLPAKSETARGYNMRAWQQGEFNYVAVSDVAAEELERLAGLVKGEAGL